MYCSNCGKEITEQTDFCPECGAEQNVHKVKGTKEIKKTKLGISINAFAAITFLTGLISFLVMILMAGYALAYEDDEGLKKNVLRAVTFVLIISVLSAVVSSADNVVAALNSLMNSIDVGSGHLRIPLGLDIVLSNVLAIIEKLGLIFFAFKAFKGREIKIKIVDDYVDKSL